MTVEEAEAWFQRNLADPECSDVAEHLWLMRRYAATADSVVELGTYDGTTALAFILGRPRWMRCIDIARRPEVDMLAEAADALGVDFTFTLGDAAEARTNQCDLLYIDTWHYAEQLDKELNNWHGYVNRYILMHDTESHGDHGMCDGEGLWVAIGKFLKQHPEWRLAWHETKCLGLTCLMRIS